MKNLLIFLVGAGLGFGSAMVVLRRSIKKKLEVMQQEMDSRAAVQGAQMETDVPFKVGKKNNDAEKDSADIRVMDKRKANVKNDKINYHKLVEEYVSSPPVPVMDREDPEDVGIDGIQFMDNEGGADIEFVDADTLKNDNRYKKEDWFFYLGDQIMCRENGERITNPAIFVGPAWQNAINLYIKNEALIRNNKTMTDYEIVIQGGLYSEEYGLDEGFSGD